MSSRINFVRTAEPKKKPAPKPKQPKKDSTKEKKAAVDAKADAAAAATPADVNAEEAAKKKALEEQRKALQEQRKKDYKEALEAELDEEKKAKAATLDGLFELEALAKVPDYSRLIHIDRTIMYDELIKVKEISDLCATWKDLVSLIHVCKNIKIMNDNPYSAYINQDPDKLFYCIAETHCIISNLPESMSAGDLRMELGSKPLSIKKKQNSTEAEVLFRDNWMAVYTFLKGKTRRVLEVVDGVSQFVEKPYEKKAIRIHDEDKKKYYTKEEPAKPADHKDSTHFDKDEE